MLNKASLSTEVLQHDAHQDTSRLYFIDIRNIPVLSREEELDLARLVKQGDEQARNLFVKHNLRLVVSIAKQYIRKCRTFSLIDLIQEGNIGLLEALERFDPERGFKFSTYATWWIRQSITRSIDERDATIRLPAGVIDLKKQLFYAEKQFVLDHGRVPTDVEMSAALGITPERLADLNASGCANTSLDAGFGDDDDANLHHLIIDEYVAAPDESIEQSSCREAMQEFLSNVLDSKEKEIVELLYGFDESQGTLDLAEIAKKFGVSRERVKQTYQRALRKLKQASCLQKEAMGF